MIKRLIEKALCRVPSIYRTLVNLRKPCNYEKLAYLKLIKHGNVVVEVGANLGYFTRLFAYLVGTKGSVLAFEPIPSTREQLLRNVNGLKQVTILPYAISDKVGKIKMYVPGVTHGQASLKMHSSSGWGAAGEVTSVSVECMPLALIKQVHALDHIDFMKVDVEGAELQVLLGARDILVRDRPILHLEIEEKWMKAFGYGPDAIEEFLRSIGYTIFLAYNNDWITIDTLIGFGGTNVVCAPSTCSLSHYNTCQRLRW
jgi:FkbM family methyltransferase